MSNPNRASGPTGRAGCRFAGALLVVLFLGASPAIAQSSEKTPPPASAQRIDDLERKLEQAMGLINSLAGEIKRLKEERTAASSPAPAGTPAQAATLGEKIQKVASQVAAVNDRIDEVEEVVFDVEEKVGSRAVVKAFDATSLDIGGFLHSAFSFVDGSNGSSSSFNRQVFELLARAELGPHWSAFLAQAFIRQSNILYTDPQGRRTPDFVIAGASPTVIAWANYKKSDAFNVRIGRWVTPQGIINIEHFPAVLLDPEQPQFLRPFGGQTMFANFMTGINIHGTKFAGMGGKGALKYDIYVGNFAGSTTHVNYGGRLGYKFGDSGFAAGLNYSGGQRGKGVAQRYNVFGFDLLYDKGPLELKSEIFASNEDAGGNRLGYYIQPAWRFANKWTAFYRYDFLDNGAGTGDQVENVIGVAFKPIPAVHLRGIVRFKQFDREGTFTRANAQVYQMFATFSF